MANVKMVDQSEHGVFNMDATIENADWIKDRWPWPEIDTVEKLREKLERDEWPVSGFKQTVIYQRNLERMPWLKEL